MGCHRPRRFGALAGFALLLGNQVRASAAGDTQTSLRLAFPTLVFATGLILRFAVTSDSSVIDFHVLGYIVMGLGVALAAFGLRSRMNAKPGESPSEPGDPTSRSGVAAR